MNKKLYLTNKPILLMYSNYNQKKLRPFSKLFSNNRNLMNVNFIFE